MFDGHIRDHASWTPRALAIFLPGRQLRYAELNADVDSLGAALAACGVRRESGAIDFTIRRKW